MRRSKQRERAVFALYQHDLTGRPLEDLFADDDTSFTRNLAANVLAEREQLDAVIGGHAHGWEVSRIAPLDRNVLRVATHELLRSEHVPAEVAINEAVQLAKRYCSADAPGFVNGILGSILKDAAAESAEAAGDDR